VSPAGSVSSIVISRAPRSVAGLAFCAIAVAALLLAPIAMVLGGAFAPGIHDRLL